MGNKVNVPRTIEWTRWLACRALAYDALYFAYSIITWLVQVIFSSPTARAREAYKTAQNYPAWLTAATALNTLLHRDSWRFDAKSRHYNWPLILSHTAAIDSVILNPDSFLMGELFRSGLHRNLGHIAAPRLYQVYFGKTKFAIEEFAGKMVALLHLIMRLPESISVGADADERRAWMPRDMKMDLVVASRRALGCSTLFLEGGAMFGLCHLGVAKALYEQGLLPRNITGTATGALMAALIGTTPKEELPELLAGRGIDLSALSEDDKLENVWGARLFGLVTRILRYIRKGYFWDVDALEECAFTNLGDVTFEEAHDKTGIILNIIVPVPGDHGIPILLNYLTAPNVLIWTAAVASNSASQSFTGGRRTTILAKDHKGVIVPWNHSELDSHPHDRMRPLDIMARAFNVNHLVISQARPHAIPFIQRDGHSPDLYGRHTRIMRLLKTLAHIIGGEMQLRVRQLGVLGLLPTVVRQFFLDVDVTRKSCITIAPDVAWQDYTLLLDMPTQQTMKYWIRIGESSTWPSICALRIRLTLEMELEKAYMHFRNELPENDAFL